MTVPDQPTRPGRRHHRFSTRVTAWWFALVALAVCGVGATLRVLAGAASEHPAGAVSALLREGHDHAEHGHGGGVGQSAAQPDGPGR
ncbi:hypothetical protein AB0E73_34500, partial [Streptomyces sp. NPDC031705]